MKIIFDANPLVAIGSKTFMRSGIFFSALNLLKEFSQENEIILYVNHKAWASIKHNDFLKRYTIIAPRSKWARMVSYIYFLRIKLDPYRKNLFIHFLCRGITAFAVCLGKPIKDRIAQCDEMEVDVFFSPFSCECSVLKMPNFALLHDAIPVLYPNYFSKANRANFNECVVSFLNPQSFYFANSHQTKTDFLGLYSKKLDENKMKVTHLGASERFYRDYDEAKNQAIRSKYKIPKDKNYIFSLCTLDPRKNLLFVIENFIELVQREEIEDLVFVLGGGYWKEFVGEIESKIEGSEGRVLHIGYVDDEDLSNLFAHSLCSVYLSLYEGFGLPVLESMQCGCPVIASNTTSIPEIVGDSGILIDPNDGVALQDFIFKIYENPSLREELASKALERSKDFSWRKCAEEMLEYMSEAVRSKNENHP